MAVALTVRLPAPVLLREIREQGYAGGGGRFAYTEFLAMLVSDEVARRENKKFSMRLRRAQFRTTKTLEQFEFDNGAGDTVPGYLLRPHDQLPHPRGRAPGTLDALASRTRMSRRTFTRNFQKATGSSSLSMPAPKTNSR